MITKAERQELRSVVRHQMKVLRSEIMQRQAELMTGVRSEIAEHFRGEDETWGKASHDVQEAVLEANRRVNDVYRELLGDSHVEAMYVRAEMPRKPTQQRTALYQQAESQLTAQVKGALLRIERQEADLLRTLSVGALESEEAHKFLAAIPTVSELVPAARLVELEAEFE